MKTGIWGCTFNLVDASSYGPLMLVWPCQRVCRQELEPADQTPEEDTWVWMTQPASPDQVYSKSPSHQQFCPSLCSDTHTRRPRISSGNSRCPGPNWVKYRIHPAGARSPQSCYRARFQWDRSGWPPPTPTGLWSERTLVSRMEGSVVPADHSYPCSVQGDPCSAGATDPPGYTAGFRLHVSQTQPAGTRLCRAAVTAANISSSLKGFFTGF